jgi:hypothetical protein
MWFYIECRWQGSWGRRSVWPSIACKFCSYFYLMEMLDFNLWSGTEMQNRDVYSICPNIEPDLLTCTRQWFQQLRKCCYIFHLNKGHKKCAHCPVPSFGIVLHTLCIAVEPTFSVSRFEVSLHLIFSFDDPSSVKLVLNYHHIRFFSVQSSNLVAPRETLSGA